MTKPIFELKDWALCGSQTQSSRRLYAKHLNCVKKGTKRVTELAWLKEEPPMCWICHIEVPEEIQALMQLHEWDCKHEV